MVKRKRVVFKVGTSTLCHSGWGLNFRHIDGIARALSDIKNEGYEVALVSSGAMGTGIGKLKLSERPAELRLKQAVSAVGQLELMHIYDKFFSEGDESRNTLSEFNSNNTQLLSAEQVKGKLLSLQYIRDELSVFSGQ